MKISTKLVLHVEVLNKNHLDILNHLRLPSSNFYLAGCTALALQIGHRTSIDFDFYSKNHFDALKLSETLQEEFPRLEFLFQEEDTLRVKIGETELSFFYYHYVLLDQLFKLKEIYIASIKDIAAMKIAAIVQRGTKRDFIDMYYLLESYSLGEIVNFTLEKYPGYQEMLILRALIYFEDAEIEKYKRQIRT